MRKHTENRIVCALVWWFWESHAPWPPRSRVIRVYSLRGYFLASGHHVWIGDPPRYLHTLYRAVGMIFPACKRLWDRGEAKIWPPKEKTEFSGGM